MNIESRLPFPADRLIGAAAHAGGAIMHHYGQPQALQNARQAGEQLAQLKAEEPEIIEPIPTASQDTWLHMYR